jgi:hypothetical protein
MLKREIFVTLREIVTKKPQILLPGDYFRWLVDNYVEALVMGVRRQCDYRVDVISLARLLYEILEHPQVTTRRSYVIQFRGTSLPAADMFQQFGVTKRGFLSKRGVRKDLAELEAATKVLQVFANKRVAHTDRRGALRRIPKFQDLHAALDALDGLAVKYHGLLKGGGQTTCMPVRQGNWRRVLQMAWIDVP